MQQVTVKVALEVQENKVTIKIINNKELINMSDTKKYSVRLKELEAKWAKGHDNHLMKRSKYMEHKDLEWLENNHESIGIQVSELADSEAAAGLFNIAGKMVIVTDILVYISDENDKGNEHARVFTDKDKCLIWFYRRLQTATNKKNKGKYPHAAKLLESVALAVEDLEY